MSSQPYPPCSQHPVQSYIKLNAVAGRVFVASFHSTQDMSPSLPCMPCTQQSWDKDACRGLREAVTGGSTQTLATD